MWIDYKGKRGRIKLKRNGHIVIEIAELKNGSWKVPVKYEEEHIGTVQKSDGIWICEIGTIKMSAIRQIDAVYRCIDKAKLNNQL
jgi:hypothetical protein